MNEKEKSVILKGQTLVNLFRINQEKDNGVAVCGYKNGKLQFIFGDSWAYSYTSGINILKDCLPLAKGKKYYYRLELSRTPSVQVSIHSHNTTTHVHVGGYANYHTTDSNQTLFTGTFIANEHDRVGVYVVDEKNGETITGTFMVLEYIEGMENWDTPYFEGLNSVVAPKFESVGKNLCHINNYETEVWEYTSGYQGFNRVIVKNIPVDELKEYKLSYVKSMDDDVPTSIGNIAIQYSDVEVPTSGYNDHNSVYTWCQNHEGRKFAHLTIPNIGSLSGTTDYRGKQLILSNIQIEEGSTSTTYEPYKSNILTVNEDVTLRGVGDVQDTLDCLTGEVVERNGEIVLNGSSNVVYESNHGAFYVQVKTLAKLNDYSSSIISDKGRVLKDHAYVRSYDSDDFAISGHRDSVNNYPNDNWIYFAKKDITSVSDMKAWLAQNPITIQYQLATESVKTVDLTIQDQDNQPQDRMKIYSSGYINTSSSTLPPILELKGITHNNKLNITTTNGTNNTQLTTLDNLALDGIICRDGTVVRDSYDVESGLYTKRVFRFTIDEEFVERYRSKWDSNSDTTYFEPYLSQNVTSLPKSINSDIGIANNITYYSNANINRVCVTNNGHLYIRLLKEELTSYDVDGLLDWIKRNGAIEVAYQLAEPQIIHMQPNMNPYVSTRPYQGEINSQGNILESSYLDYTSEQSIISPKPLGDGDVLRWEQGSQCYVYENEKDYIPLTSYNQPIGTVLDLEEEDGEQFVENLDGGEIVVDVPFKEKAVYERHLVSHEDNVIYPTQDKLDPTGKIEVDYICGATWQNPNDLSDIRHVGTLREDGQYDVTIRRSGDDEIRLMDGITHISLDGDGLNPSEFELTYFNSGGVEVGKYGDTSHTLENCVLDSKLETGMVYGDTLVNLLDTRLFYNASSTVTRDDDGWITVPGSGGYVPCRHAYQGNLKTDTLYTLIVDVKSNTCSGPLALIDKFGGGNAESAFTINAYSIASKATGRFIQALTTKSDLSGVKCDFRGVLSSSAKTGESIVFRYMLLEGDYTSYPMSIPYFEGVGSTIVNGFTTTNEDETQSITYTLPSPITLNKVGDVADTFDIVGGVETRNVAVIVPQVSKQFVQNDEYVGFGYDLATEEKIESSGTIFTTTSINNLGIPFINSNIVTDGAIARTSEGIGKYNTTELKIILAKSRLNLPEYTQNTVNQWLKENLVCYIKKYTPQTIQHTLIPSSIQTTQEPTFILPQPLRSVPNGICDRLYWDENKGHYCIEKRIEQYTVNGSDNEPWKLHQNSSANYPYYQGLDSLLKIQYTGNNSLSSIYFENFKSLNGIDSIDSSSSTNEGASFHWGNLYIRFNANKYPSVVDVASLRTYFNANPMNLYYPLATPQIIDLPHLNKKLTLPTQPDTLPIGYKVENPKSNPQLGLTIPYKQLNYPSRPQNIDFKMDIADYVLTWDDVKEARQYNVILNDRVIATVKEPQWNSGEEMYGYIMVEAQNELAENLSEELYIKTVPNAPAQLTVGHNPMTNYYDFEISFIKTSAIAEYYTVQYRIDGGEWVYKTIQSDEIDPNSKVLWRFSVYEINEQIEVWATATNEIGTNDILPIATYYMSPTPQWTYRVNSKELFVRWMDESPYDTQYKLRYQYKSDGIFRYAYFEGDKQEIGKLYEALIPLADDEEVSIALCVISEKENLYTKPIRASKELDPNIKPPKNFNYHWLARGLIEFYWEDNYDVDVQYEAIVEHKMSTEQTWIQDTRIFDSTDVSGVGTVYRLQYQLEELEEIRVKVRMKWAMNDTEWTESLTTVFIPVEGNPPTWIRRTQTQEGLLVEWEPQQYVDSYHVYVMSNGEELQHLETMDNFIIVDLDYSNPIDIEIYEATRFTGGVNSDPSDKMQFRPTMDKQQMIYNVVTPDTLTYEIEVDTIQRAIKERQVIHDINTTPKVKTKEPMDVAIKSPFTLSYHPLRLDVHQAGAKYYGDTELHIKTLDVKSRDAIEVLSFERVTDQYGVDFTVYTPSASKYPITLEVNRVRIVCFGDSLTSGHPGFWAETGTGDPQHCYEYWLDRRLKGQYEIINKGYGSDTTDRMLSRFDRDVLANNPQYCIIQGGTNDLYWAMAESMGDQEALNMKLDVMKANIMEMVKRCWDNNIIPIVGNLIPRTGATGIYKTALYDFNAWIISWCTGQAAEGRNIFYVDLFNAGKEAVPPTPIEDPTNPGAMNPIYDGDALFDEFGNIIKQGRGIHLNKEGYRIWAEAIPLSIFKTYDSGLRMYKDLHCTDEDNYDDSDKQNPFYTISIDNVRRSKTKTVVRYVKNIGKTQVLFAMYASDEYNMSIEFVGSDGEKGAYANGLLAPNMIAKVTMEINLDNKDSKASFNLHLAAREYNQN